MITSINSACQVPFKKDLYSNPQNKNLYNNPAVKYTDSFVKHSVESVPALLAMTTLWAAIDKTSGKMPFKQAFANNFKVFFLPVLVASSALLSYIDNRKAKQNT